MPKSRILGTPSAVTRMLPGLRSRWTTRFWCRYWTASQTLRKRARRSPERGVPLGAVDVEGPAGDELHHQVGPAVVRGAAVEEGGDVRVLEPGQDLALRPQATQQAPRRDPGTDQLQGHLALEALVVPNRAVDRTHPAAADLGDQAIGPDREAAGGCHGFTGLRLTRSGARRRVSRRRFPVREGVMSIGAALPWWRASHPVPGARGATPAGDRFLGLGHRSGAGFADLGPLPRRDQLPRLPQLRPGPVPAPLAPGLDPGPERRARGHRPPPTTWTPAAPRSCASTTR